MHYFQFNIGDYASHTRHLSLLEDLAYRRLLDVYYLKDGALVGTVAEVARQIGMREHIPEVEQVLQDFFIADNQGGWGHIRCDAEIAHFRDKSLKASNAGKASAERRNNGRSTDVQPTNNHKPITNNHEPVIIEVYPLWLPIDSWKGWVEMRKQRKRPLTDRAKARAYKKLEALHSAGHDINELLDRSTINGWLDIYEPKGTTNAGNSNHAAEPTNPMVRAVIASQARRATNGERPTDDWA